MTAFVYLMFQHQFKWFSTERVSSSILPYFQNITLSYTGATGATGKYWTLRPPATGDLKYAISSLVNWRAGGVCDIL